MKKELVKKNKEAWRKGLENKRMSLGMIHQN